MQSRLANVIQVCRSRDAGPRGLELYTSDLSLVISLNSFSHCSFLFLEVLNVLKSIDLGFFKSCRNPGGEIIPAGCSTSAAGKVGNLV